jgi:hypothetical protein
LPDRGLRFILKIVSNAIDRRRLPLLAPPVGFW